MIKTIKKLIKYLYLKWKYRKKLQFNYSSSIDVNSSFEGMNKIYNNSFFSGEMGYGSYVGWNSSLKGKIGRFTSIAPFVRCNHGKHPFEEPYATTCPAFFSIQKQNGDTFTTKQKYDEFTYVDSKKQYPFIIGSDCWIGEGVFITGGITIGDGAVALARSVITKDVPPYAIVAGVPAKILRFRYDQETIDFLLDFQWWYRDIAWLKDNVELMCDIHELKKRYNNYKPHKT